MNAALYDRLQWFLSQPTNPAKMPCPHDVQETDMDVRLVLCTLCNEVMKDLNEDPRDYDAEAKDSLIF